MMCGLVLVKPHSIATWAKLALAVDRMALLLFSVSAKRWCYNPSQWRLHFKATTADEVSPKRLFSEKNAASVQKTLSLSLSHMLPAKTANVDTCVVRSAKPFTRVPEVCRMWVAKNRRDCRMCGQRW